MIRSYYDEGVLGVEMMYRGLAWLDTGTPRSMLDAASFIGAIEERQGRKVACLEEVAYRMKFITLKAIARDHGAVAKMFLSLLFRKIISEEL